MIDLVPMDVQKLEQEAQAKELERLLLAENEEQRRAEQLRKRTAHTPAVDVADSGGDHCLHFRHAPPTLKKKIQSATWLTFLLIVILLSSTSHVAALYPWFWGLPVMLLGVAWLSFERLRKAKVGVTLSCTSKFFELRNTGGKKHYGLLRRMPAAKTLKALMQAAREARDAWLWYQARSLSAANRFMTEHNRALERIDEAPSVGHSMCTAHDAF